MSMYLGMGGWQTVSVRTIDEAEEARQARGREEERLREAEEQRKTKASERTGGGGEGIYIIYVISVIRNHVILWMLQELMAAAVLDSADSGDVLRAYDPHGTGSYKGIVVSNDTIDTEVCIHTYTVRMYR
jgi:hypothetical protein